MGAILKTNGNPGSGGGRAAAARALGGNGVGIKVSNDGYVEVYKGVNPPLRFA